MRTRPAAGAVLAAALVACGGDDESGGGAGAAGAAGATGGAAAVAGVAGGGAGGTAGSSGAAGVAGSAGAAGSTAGAAGSAGAAGAAGTSGTAGAAGTSGTAGAAGMAGGAGAGGSAGTSCLAQPMLSALGRSHVLVGASMEDSVATQAPFDLQYQYLSGGTPDGSGPCTSCATGCTAGGQSCANSGPGCAWWGCWQWDQEPPGAFVRDYVQRVTDRGQIPMITYYQQLHTSGVAEGDAQVTAAADTAVAARYLADWRFLLEQIGTSRALLHVEPDFWGYAQHRDANPTRIAAAVASANPTDCATQPDTIAGLGRCMIAMVRRYAPNARVSLHASGWATKIDVLQNRNASLDVAGEARKLAAFLRALGDADFVTVDPSDRDAAWYDTQGQDRWWDDTNATLPNFTQGLAWSSTLAEELRLPIVWWQVPVGNVSLPNVTNRWKDNRVDYFFAHLDEVAAAHGLAVAFGAGDGNQTTPSTDGGNLVAKVSAYAASGRQPACP